MKEKLTTLLAVLDITPAKNNSTLTKPQSKTNPRPKTNPPTDATIYKRRSDLANIYKVSADYLLGLTDNPRGMTTANEEIKSVEMTIEERLAKVEEEIEKMKSK